MADERECGPVYGVPLLSRLPVSTGGLFQRLPRRDELEHVRKVSERTAVGYEIVLSHFYALINEHDPDLARLYGVPSETKDECNPDSTVGESQELSTERQHFRLLRFNLVRFQRGVEAARVEVDANGAWLWMSKDDVVNNMADFGVHQELLKAYGMYIEAESGRLQKLTESTQSPSWMN